MSATAIPLPILEPRTGELDARQLVRGQARSDRVFRGAVADQCTDAVAAGEQDRDDVAADEPGGAGDEDG